MTDSTQLPPQTYTSTYLCRTTHLVELDAAEQQINPVCVHEQHQNQLLKNMLCFVSAAYCIGRSQLQALRAFSVA